MLVWPSSWPLAGPVEDKPPKAFALAAPPCDPLDHRETGYETTAFWSTGGNATPLNYLLLPQIVTIKTRPVLDLKPRAGSRLVVRNRLSILGGAYHS